MGTTPTPGFELETIEYKNISLIAWDVGGNDKIRILWRHYYQNVKGIIFVVDSNDKDKIETAKEELYKMLVEENLKNAPLLVFANKQDIPGKMTKEEVTQELGLNYSMSRQWYVQASCAPVGDGLYEGLEWLTNQIAAN